MIAIPQMLSFPDGTPIEKTQGTIANVYEYKNTPRGGTVQNATLKDVGGRQIKLVVWDHPDIKTLEGKNIVIHSGASRAGMAGVKIKHSKYTVKKDGPDKGKEKTSIELHVSKSGQFHSVEVYSSAIDPQGAAESNSSQSVHQVVPTQGGGAINGAKVGMALNNAVLILTARGDNCDIESIRKLSVDIIKLSNELEQGKLDPQPPKANVTTVFKAPPAAEPAPSQEPDGDEPF